MAQKRKYSYDEVYQIYNQMYDEEGTTSGNNKIVTIVFPLFSGRFATSIAACAFAPAETPTKIPSSLANLLAIL